MNDDAIVKWFGHRLVVHSDTKLGNRAGGNRWPMTYADLRAVLAAMKPEQLRSLLPEAQNAVLAEIRRIHGDGDVVGGVRRLKARCEELFKTCEVLKHEFHQDPTHPRRIGLCDYTFGDGDYCGSPQHEHPKTLQARCEELEKELAEIQAVHIFNRGIQLERADELESKLRKLEQRNAALEKVIDALPRCRPWLSGSGGHRRFGSCPRIATWFELDSDCDRYYCDEHKNEIKNTAFEFDELPWADAVRRTLREER